ncbi:MAG: exosortase C-terminal domain/associated protein EpsI [Candidatus Omnitrophota bacterium]
MRRDGYSLAVKSYYHRSIIAGLILLACIAVVYFLPRPKYTGKAFTVRVLEAVPLRAGPWQGDDVEIKDRPEDEVYNFISRILGRRYINTVRPWQSVLLVVLDAGNFHYPKVCFRGAGFRPEALAPKELNILGHKIKVQLIRSQKGKERILTIYWICIDKKIVATWAEQKLRQLYYSLFNKKRVGLMVRVDVPLAGDTEDGMAVGRDFLVNLCREIPAQMKNYLFGRVD